ncbi:MAG: nucleotidyltransferase domain-containing protein [Thermoleophilia bacterium]
MLSTLITSKTRVELITWFVTHPDERFHYSQLLNIFKASAQSVQNELKRLEKVGFLSSQKEGNIRFYWINKDFILYPEIKSMIFKTVGVGEELRKSLVKVSDVKAAFIYGSVAKNLEDARSDIDVMVIGDVSEDEVHKAISKSEERLGREVNYSLFSPGDWKKQMKAKKAFVSNVAKDKKIFLIGTEDELRKLN